MWNEKIKWSLPGVGKAANSGPYAQPVLMPPTNISAYIQLRMGLNMSGALETLYIQYMDF